MKVTKSDVTYHLIKVAYVKKITLKLLDANKQ